MIIDDDTYNNVNNPTNGDTSKMTENQEKDPKKVALYLKEKALLETFLSKGAISKAQFEKSFGDLTRLMGMEDYQNDSL